MARWPRVLHAHDLPPLQGLPAGGPRHLRRLVTRLLVLVALAALAAWLGHLALAPAGHDAASRLAETVAGWLRAAWSAGG
jgi:hypothetical protein